MQQFKLMQDDDGHDNTVSMWIGGVACAKRLPVRNGNVLEVNLLNPASATGRRGACACAHYLSAAAYLAYGRNNSTGNVPVQRQPQRL